MTNRSRRAVLALGVLVVGGLSFLQWRSRPAPSVGDVKAYVTIKDLMESRIDPIADNIFDAVGTDVSANGVAETRPTTDADWAKVRMGAVTLAEATNLLKIPRPVAPPGAENRSGANAPELSPEQIQSKIGRDRDLWNKYADELRDEALKVLKLVKTRNADDLFQAGGRIDRVCETCHLEYWYPGDRKAVLEDEQKRATIRPPKK